MSSETLQAVDHGKSIDASKFLPGDTKYLVGIYSVSLTNF